LGQGRQERRNGLAVNGLPAEDDQRGAKMIISTVTPLGRFSGVFAKMIIGPVGIRIRSGLDQALRSTADLSAVPPSRRLMGGQLMPGHLSPVDCPSLAL
jgi:hypothetical protein